MLIGSVKAEKVFIESMQLRFILNLSRIPFCNLELYPWTCEGCAPQF